MGIPGNQVWDPKPWLVGFPRIFGWELSQGLGLGLFPGLGELGIIPRLWAGIIPRVGGLGIIPRFWDGNCPWAFLGKLIITNYY